MTAGSIIVRQRGTKFIAGQNVGTGRDWTLFAPLSVARPVRYRGMTLGRVVLTADTVGIRNGLLRYGALLARAHAQALTADRVLGVTVIAPLLAGRESAFADELTALAKGDAAQVIADHALIKDQDLSSLVLENP